MGGALRLQQVPLTHVLGISFRMGLLFGHEWAFLSVEIMCLLLFFSLLLSSQIMFSELFYF